MRQSFAVLTFLAIFACRSVPPDNGGSVGAGTTTIASGAHTRRAETTNVSPEAELTLDRTSFAPGGEVIMRIASRSNDTLGFNPCSNRVVERQQGESWAPHAEPNRMCTMELRLLLPRQSQTAITDLPANLTSGTYRILLNFSRQRTPPPNARPDWGVVSAISPSFRVQ